MAAAGARQCPALRQRVKTVTSHSVEYPGRRNSRGGSNNSLSSFVSLDGASSAFDEYRLAAASTRTGNGVDVVTDVETDPSHR